MSNTFDRDLKDTIGSAPLPVYDAPNVIPFASPAPPEEEQITLAGMAVCMNCKHEWAAVAPLGLVSSLECPHCKAMKGHMKYPVIHKDEDTWTCTCGNDLFLLTPKRIYCPNCGRDHNPYE